MKKILNANNKLLVGNKNMRMRLDEQLVAGLFKVGWGIINPGKIFMASVALPDAILGAMAQLDKNTEGELADFVCQYAIEIGSCFSATMGQVIQATRDAHWIAFDVDRLAVRGGCSPLSIGPTEEICEDRRTLVLNMLTSGDEAQFTGLAINAINFHRVAADMPCPKYFSESAHAVSRIHFANKLWAPSIITTLPDDCDHNAARAMILCAGALMQAIEKISNRVRIGTDLGYGSGFGPNARPEAAVLVNKTGYRSDGTGVGNLIEEVNAAAADDGELTKLRSPIETALETVKETGVFVYNRIWDWIEFPLPFIDVEPRIEDKCGKLPCRKPTLWDQTPW